MITVLELVDHINATTGLFAEPAKQAIADIEQTGKIYVGYSTIASNHPNQALAMSPLEQGGENLVQSFEIQLTTTIESFKDHWLPLYQTLLGYNNSANEKIHTGMTYVKGGKVLLANSKLIWADFWTVGFPAFHPDFLAPYVDP